VLLRQRLEHRGHAGDAPGKEGAAETHPDGGAMVRWRKRHYATMSFNDGWPVAVVGDRGVSLKLGGE
jgi:hypothetical protein